MNLRTTGRRVGSPNRMNFKLVCPFQRAAYDQPVVYAPWASGFRRSQRWVAPSVVVSECPAGWRDNVVSEFWRQVVNVSEPKLGKPNRRGHSNAGGSSKARRGPRCANADQYDAAWCKQADNRQGFAERHKKGRRNSQPWMQADKSRTF